MLPHLRFWRPTSPESLFRAHELEREPAEEPPEPAAGAEVECPEDGLDGGGGRHRRDLLDEGEDGDHKQRRAKGLQHLQQQGEFCKIGAKFQRLYSMSTIFLESKPFCRQAFFKKLLMKF